MITMKNEKYLGKKAKFLTIERPLIPCPPIDSEPHWYYANTLGFFKNGKKVWEQKIPEANMSWIPTYRFDDTKKEYVYRCDMFDKYFHCEVFLDKVFGWQLRIKISHNYANIWHKKMMGYIKRYHNNHFKKQNDKLKGDINSMD